MLAKKLSVIRPHLLEDWEFSALSSLKSIAEFILRSSDESVTFNRPCCVSGRRASPDSTTERFNFIGTTRLTRINLVTEDILGEDEFTPTRGNIVAVDYADQRHGNSPTVYLDLDHPADHMARRLESALTEGDDSHVVDWLRPLVGAY